MTKDKLLFIHVPKCGGHSANAAFYQMFGIDNVLKVWDPRHSGDVLATEFPSWPIGQITSYRGITGHLYFPQVLETMGAELLQREYLVTTIVRDPIRQVLSLWNYINFSTVHAHHENVKNMELSQFVQEYTANQQSIFLSGDGDGMKALNILDKHFDLVRPLKQFDQFVSQIATHFDKPAPQPAVKNKTGAVRTTPADLDDDIITMIKQRNSEDIVLFEGMMNRLQQTKTNKQPSATQVA